MISKPDSTEKDSASRQAMKLRRKLGLSTQVNLRNIRIAVMGQDGVGKTGKVETRNLRYFVKLYCVNVFGKRDVAKYGVLALLLTSLFIDFQSVNFPLKFFLSE